MGDFTTRILERHLEETTRSIFDELRWARERVRSGLVPRERVVVAARLGGATMGVALSVRVSRGDLVPIFEARSQWQRMRWEPWRRIFVGGGKTAWLAAKQALERLRGRPGAALPAENPVAALRDEVAALQEAGVSPLATDEGLRRALIAWALGEDRRRARRRKSD